MYTVGAGFSLWDRIAHLILPVTMGMVGWVAWYSRFLRSSMLDVIHKEYIQVARAKGASAMRVFLRHALKNAAIPVVTMLALDLPYIFAGSVYVELLFSWPGMGRLFYQAALRRDYPVLMASLVIVSALVMLCSLLADLVYGLLDPRGTLRQPMKIDGVIPGIKALESGGRERPVGEAFGHGAQVWRRFKRHPGAILGSLVFGLVILLALLAPLSPYDPVASDLSARAQGPSAAHWFGTDV